MCTCSIGRGGKMWVGMFMSGPKLHFFVGNSIFFCCRKFYAEKEWVVEKEDSHNRKE
jgi:hypothetical protein